MSVCEFSEVGCSVDEDEGSSVLILLLVCCGGCVDVCDALVGASVSFFV